MHFAKLFDSQKRENNRCLVETIAKPDGLTSMRGPGQKSINEIKTKLMVCAYDGLSNRQKLEFLQDMVEKNKQ